MVAVSARYTGGRKALSGEACGSSASRRGKLRQAGWERLLTATICRLTESAVHMIVAGLAIILLRSLTHLLRSSAEMFAFWLCSRVDAGRLWGAI